MTEDLNDPPEMTIEATPRISVFLNNAAEITIQIAKMDSELNRVDTDTISIPVDFAKQVAEALLAIADHQF